MSCLVHCTCVLEVALGIILVHTVHVLLYTHTHVCTLIWARSVVSATHVYQRCLMCISVDVWVHGDVRTCTCTFVHVPCNKCVDVHVLLFKVYIRSTDYDRTLMSAESLLAALYPPEGDQVIHEVVWMYNYIYTVWFENVILIMYVNVDPKDIHM